MQDNNRIRNYLQQILLIRAVGQLLFHEDDVMYTLHQHHKTRKITKYQGTRNALCPFS